jgi:hypothetical protein
MVIFNDAVHNIKLSSRLKKNTKLMKTTRDHISVN